MLNIHEIHHVQPSSLNTPADPADARVTRHPSLVDQVVERVFNAVVSGAMPPGSVLTEEGLAERCEVSRTPAREAMKRLLALGLICARPRRGFTIIELSLDDVRQLTELREELELLALRLALPRLDAAMLAELRTIQEHCDAMQDAGNRHQTYVDDSRFHLAIARFSGNRYLAEAAQRLDAKILLCRTLIGHSADEVRASMRMHWEVLEALGRQHLDQAVDTMRRHVRLMVDSWPGQRER